MPAKYRLNDNDRWLDSFFTEDNRNTLLNNTTEGFRSGRVIYIDPQNPNATDTRTGLSPYSKNKPFASFSGAYASGSIQTGDAVVLMPGNHGSGTFYLLENVHYIAQPGVVTTGDISALEAGSFYIYGDWDAASLNLSVAGVIVHASTARLRGSISMSSSTAVTLGEKYDLGSTTNTNITLSGTSSLRLLKLSSLGGTYFSIKGESNLTIDSGSVVRDGSLSPLAYPFNISDSTNDGPTINLNNLYIQMKYNSASSTTAGVGIDADSDVKLTLNNCTIVTENNTGSVVSILRPTNPLDVIIKGTLNQTHEPSSTVTYKGGVSITSSDFA